MNEPIPLDIRELYKGRVIIFLEDGPQSNKYYQLLLTPDQLKPITDVLYIMHGGKLTTPENEGMVNIVVDLAHPVKLREEIESTLKSPLVIPNF